MSLKEVKEFIDNLPDIAIDTAVTNIQKINIVAEGTMAPKVTFEVINYNDSNVVPPYPVINK